MKKVVVLGSGKIGKMVSHLLANTGDYQVIATDASDHSIHQALHATSGQKLSNISGKKVDFADANSLRDALKGADYAISCAPFYSNVLIADVCKQEKVNYLDLTEDVATTKEVKRLAQDSSVAFIPQCGLAPGFISIVANDLASQFETIASVKMRVGALPIYPHNRLKYNLTWSTEGLINEYCNPCEAVVDGRLITVQPLEGLEVLSVDGTEYEAFNTSGGLGTLAETFAGKVRQLDYKSIRYPGHQEILSILLHDLKMRDDRTTMCKIFEHALPYTLQDVVLIYVTVKGTKNGRLQQSSYVKKVYNNSINGEHWGGIQITTACGICAVLDLHREGKIPQKGFVRQEDVSFSQFMANRFGKYYS